MMYYVYVLKSKDYRKSYVGISSRPKKRLREHNLGNSFYTRKYKPWSLIYKEKFLTRMEARKRETYLKTCAGRKFLKQVFVNHSGVV